MFSENKHFLYRYFPVIIIIICAVITTELIINTTNHFNQRISFEIKSAAGGTFQLFYSTNKVHNKKNSIRKNVKITKYFDICYFTLTKKNLKSIRFDPPSDLQIRTIKIGNIFSRDMYSGQSLFNALMPIKDIGSIKLTDNIVHITINGKDPQLKLSGIGLVNSVGTKFKIAILIFRIFAVSLFSLIFILIFKWIKAYYKFILSEKHTINLSKNVFLSLKIIVFSWFLFQLLYFAFNIKKGVSPDERYHIEVSKFYSTPGVFHLQNTDATIRYGSLTTEPHLYYLVMGKLLMLKPDSIIDYKYLRFLNILISLFSFYLTYLLAKEITSNKLIQLSALIAQSNVLMFVFLSSMVSYDNLVNLIAVASFLFLMRFLRYFSLHYLLLFLTTMVVGGLTKITYLPLILLQLAVLLFYSKKIFQQRFQLLSEIKRTNNIITGIIFISFLGANIYLYGGNFVKYHKIRPGAELVIGKEKALSGYGIYMRNYKLLSTAHTREQMPLHEFIPKYFKRTMETIFNVTGHLSLMRNYPDLLFYLILLGLGLLMIIFQLKVIINDYKLLVLLYFIIGYVFIVFYVNYSSYTHMRTFGLALQGRYNFPVLSLMAIFSMNTLLFKLSDKAKIPVIIIITFLFIYYCFFWFIQRVTPEWFSI